MRQEEGSESPSGRYLLRLMEMTLETQTPARGPSGGEKAHQPIALVRIFPYDMPLPTQTVSSGFLV